MAEYNEARRCGMSASGYQPGPSELLSYPVVARRTSTYHSLNTCAYLPSTRAPPGPVRPGSFTSTSASGPPASTTTWKATNSLRAALSETVFVAALQIEFETRKSPEG